MPLHFSFSSITTFIFRTKEDYFKKTKTKKQTKVARGFFPSSSHSFFYTPLKCTYHLVFKDNVKQPKDQINY